LLLFRQVGFKESKCSEWTDQWWYSAYQSSQLKNIGASSSDSDSSDSETEESRQRKHRRKHSLHSVPTDEELFQALGGARFGMRAQSSQTGKIKRSEEMFESQYAKQSRQGSQNESATTDGGSKVSTVSDGSKTGTERSEKSKKKKKKRKLREAGENKGIEQKIKLPSKKKRKKESKRSSKPLQKQQVIAS
jgi:hypothetical protein